MLANENTLLQTHFWTQQLGLMPVPLHAVSDSTWVMLNGAKGNFCLNLAEKGEINDFNFDQRSIAWSSNVGHHISVTSEKVEIHRWDNQPSALERFSTSSVNQNLEAFYRYLENSAPSAEKSVVPHAIRTFRSLRAVPSLQKENNGIQALKAFLLLLACGVENQPEAAFDIHLWTLPDEAEAVRERISTDDWHALYKELTKGLAHDQLRLHLDLTLRHASGQLFQEAHFEAHRESQMSLPLGLTPTPVKLKVDAKRRFENKAAGLHFTPPALVRVMVEETLRIFDKNADHVRIFDPACGSAEFLREALRQLLIAEFKGKIELIGWDISEAACDMARFILQREVSDWKAFDRVTISIEQGDSLGEDKVWPQEVSLALMNPPFVRWNEMLSEHKNATERLLLPLLGINSPKSAGNYDLSHVFFVKAAHSLSSSGIIATILPVSVLDSKAAAKVRGHLSDLLHTDMIARLGSHSLFSNALVDAAFYIGQKKGTAQTDSLPLAFWSDYRSSSSSAGFRALRRSHSQNAFSQVGEEIQEDKTGFCFYYQSLLGSKQDYWLPRPSKSWKLLRYLTRSENFSSVGNLFRVEHGIITGHTDAFVLSEIQWRKLPISEQKFFRIGVNNDSINNGRVTSLTYVFYPYGIQTFESEAEIRSKIPQYFFEHLEPFREALIKRPRADSNQWWLLNESRIAQKAVEPKIISSHRGSAGAFIWDEDGDFMALQGHSWRPKHPRVLSNTLGLAYLAILNSSMFFRLISAVSHHVSGGQWDLSKRYVDQLPIPNLFDAAASPDLIEELANVGRIIKNEGLPAEGLSPDSMAVVARAYGLDDIED